MPPPVSQRDMPRLDTDQFGVQHHSGVPATSGGNPTDHVGVAPAPEGHPRLAVGPAPHFQGDPQSLEWDWHPARRGVGKEPHCGGGPQGLLWVQGSTPGGILGSPVLGRGRHWELGWGQHPIPEGGHPWELG